MKLSSLAFVLLSAAAVALCPLAVAPAHADDTTIKQDAHRLGHEVSRDAKDVGHSVADHSRRFGQEVARDTRDS
ncbi:MAG: hypothetical protein ACRETJ_12875, partial [Steroidobacteraceae bacterium]